MRSLDQIYYDVDNEVGITDYTIVDGEEDDANCFVVVVENLNEELHVRKVLEYEDVDLILDYPRILGAVDYKNKKFGSYKIDMTRTEYNGMYMDAYHEPVVLTYKEFVDTVDNNNLTSKQCLYKRLGMDHE